MTLNHPSVSALVAALNNPARARIGNPWTGTFHLSITADEIHDVAHLGEALSELGVEFQTNFRRDANGTPKRAFVSVYAVESLRGLLDAVTGSLAPARKTALETLVRAREPIPMTVLKSMQHYVGWGESHAKIAQRLNAKPVIDGMGGKRWTAKKVAAALAEYDQQRDENKAMVA
jgi:hypothetical protein